MEWQFVINNQVHALFKECELGVLQASQHVELVTLPNHNFTGQAQSSKRLTCTCAHSIARNWQLPFLNQWKGENDHIKYFMINLQERMLPDPVRDRTRDLLITSLMHIRLSHQGRLLFQRQGIECCLDHFYTINLISRTWNVRNRSGICCGHMRTSA